MDKFELLGQVRKKARKPSKALPETDSDPAPAPMPEPSPTSSLPFRQRSEFWAFFGPGLAITILGFILAYSFVGPPPPKRLRFASGPSWGAYNRFAQEYKELLARQGIAIEVVQTKGSSENLELLSQGKADIAFVQGGLAPQNSKVQLQALGSVYYEPLWVFVRSPKIPREFSELSGKKMAIGPMGSGTRAIALEILRDAGMTREVTTVNVGGEAAEKMFNAAELDALFLVGAPDIPVIERMLTAPGVQLMQFARAHALERRHHFLSVIKLYAGVVDLKRNIPPNDVELLAPAATLVVRQDFHRALPAVVLAAAREIHGPGSILTQHNEFPSPQYCSFPLAQEGRHFYQYGTSFLYRHLSFRWASAIDRMTILLLPFVGLLVPIIRLLPPVYNWTMKRKIYRHYRDLQRLEALIGHAPVETLLDQLDSTDDKARALTSMPAAYSPEIYALRSNLDRVRGRLKRLDREEKSRLPQDSES